MANFDIQDAEFNEMLRKFEVTDPVHADLINRVIEQLIRNDVALKNAEDMSEKTVIFEEAKDRKNIESGETLKTLFGKVRKWFSSLGAAAFYSVVNSDTVTESGFLPDARLLKAHKDTLNALQQRITNLESSVTALNSKIYPIGSIYMSIKNTNPSIFLGGTWVAWGTGRVPVGVNTADSNFNVVEKTGGANTHTLTVAQMPAHNHVNASYSVAVNPAITSDNKHLNWQNVNNNWGVVNNTVLQTSQGGGQAHNNLQPYITCYMWKRTA